MSLLDPRIGEDRLQDPELWHGETGPEVPAEPLGEDRAASLKPRTAVIISFTLAAFLVLLEYPYQAIKIPATVMLALAFCSALFMVYVTFEVPGLLLPILISFIPFSKLLPGDFGGILKAFNLLNMLLIGLFVAHAWRHVYHADRMYRPTPIDKIFFIFILISSVSFFRTVYKTEGLFTILTHYKRYITPWLLFIMVSSFVRSRQEIRVAVTIMPIIFILVCVFSAKKFFIDHQGFRSMGWIRLQGVCDQPNSMGAFLTYYAFIPLAFGLMKGQQLLWRAFCLGGWMIGFKCLLGTASRGASLAFYFATLAFFWIRMRVIFIIIIVGTIFIVLNPSFFPDWLVGRWRPILTAWKQERKISNVDKSGQSRLDLAVAGLEMANDNPVFGVGYRMFRKRIYEYLPHTQVSDAHNQFVQILAENGYPGLLFFLLTVFGVMYFTWKVAREEKDPVIKTFAWGFFAGQMGSIIVNLTGCRLESIEMIGWYWIGAALIMRQYVIHREEEAQTFQEQKEEDKRSKQEGASDYAL